MKFRSLLCVTLITAILLPMQRISRAEESPIPPAAWTHPIGQPFSGGHTKDTYQVIDDGPRQGAPLGGLGAGTIGRTYAGDFARWHLNVGFHAYATLPADMFSLFTKQGDKTNAQALFAGEPDDNTLNKWKWNYSVGDGTYWALYPRSGFVYDGLPIKLNVEQFSPIIPNDYKVSSYPVAIFNYTATNPGSDPVTVGLMFTWQSLLAQNQNTLARGGFISQLRKDSDLVGIEFSSKEHGTAPWDGTMAIAAQQVPGVTLSDDLYFAANGDGGDIWNDFAADGALSDAQETAESKVNELPAAGISATFTLQPGQTLKIPFFLSWDLPVMSFGDDFTHSWYKRYTAFFGREGTHAWDIVKEASAQQESWRQAIVDWQTPILSDPGRPDWYKTALFNELYYIADGGSAWENGKVGAPEPPKDYIGHYALMECFDYRFYATFDVDFYASYALLQLWPELEKDTIRTFAATIPQEDLTPTIIQSTGGSSVRKLAGAVPHDLGGPDEAPWEKVNLYNWRDVTRWKDLAPKFVLRLYRDAVLLKAPELIRVNFAGVKQAMAYLAAMDKDGDGIPENENVPDQTYDTWPVSGVSAYSGGLWLAALRASADMARMVNDADAQKVYEDQLAKAQAVYENTLWTGSYYAYDSSTNASHDSIMADQLAGQWYLDFLDEKVLPNDHVEKALHTIFDYNVDNFADGQMGAVNGMKITGLVDTSDIQSQEVWTGVTYALASMMLNRGLRDEAWKTAYGVYHVTYEKYGYWFRTPEAYDETGNFRATMYLRPLSIWAIDMAYRNTQQK